MQLTHLLWRSTHMLWMSPSPDLPYLATVDCMSHFRCSKNSNIHGCAIGVIGHVLKTFKAKQVNSRQCISGSMSSGFSIPWIADWIQVHINKARSRPLSLYVSEKHHLDVENGPKMHLKCCFFFFLLIVAMATIKNHLSTYLGPELWLDTQHLHTFQWYHLCFFYDQY